MNKNISCALTKAAKKKDVNALHKLLQRVKPTATKASVRYDVNAKHWAVLDKQNNPTQHFDTAIMENVSFRSCEVKEYIGCAGHKTTFIGIADGDLYLHRHAGNLVGAQNLHFKDGKFRDSNDCELKTVAKIAILPDRRAIYWNE